MWQELSLPDAIRAAKAAGFDAVECHWPYNDSVDRLKSALDETGLPMLGLNTVRGNVAAGENGLAALPVEKRKRKPPSARHWITPWRSVRRTFMSWRGKAEGDLAQATYVAN